MSPPSSAPQRAPICSAARPTDIHAHLWPEEFLSALGRRRLPPRLRRQGGTWIVDVPGEAPALLHHRQHDPSVRAAGVRAAGLEAVVIAPSSPLGSEALPTWQAERLLTSYHDGLRKLGKPFRAWAAAGLHDPRPEDLVARLDEGFVGLSLPTGALVDTRGLDRVAPLLDVLTRRGAPLFVHPGPAPWTSRRGDPDPKLPAWWPALTSYISEMHAAWLTWVTFGRREHPQLRVCFALLAGLAPLHHERLAHRGGPALQPDALTFYETSSYDAPTVRFFAGVVGQGAVVYGSDHPVLPLDPDLRHPEQISTINPARLLGKEER